MRLVAAYRGTHPAIRLLRTLNVAPSVAARRDDRKPSAQFVNDSAKKIRAVVSLVTRRVR